VEVNRCHKPPRRARVSDDLKAVLKRRGVSDPLDEVLKLLGESIEITEVEAASPMIQSLLAADYQLEPGAGGKLVLKPRLSLRLKAWLELSGFCHAKLRTAEIHNTTATEIVFNVQSFGEPAAQREAVTLPARAELIEDGAAVNES
jgi:hypothetical protein